MQALSRCQECRIWAVYFGEMYKFSPNESWGVGKILLKALLRQTVLPYNK